MYVREHWRLLVSTMPWTLAAQAGEADYFDAVMMQYVVIGLLWLLPDFSPFNVERPAAALVRRSQHP